MPYTSVSTYARALSGNKLPYKTVRERMAAYNALPQALGAIPCLEYYIARASNMQEAKAQWAADIKARYHNYLDNY